ncbi:KpsF/GutQ family sugar-phosphate isomerase [Vibrio sp. E150_011]
MHQPYDNEEICRTATTIIEREIKHASQLIGGINDNFANACHSIAGCKGKVIISGIGKSGHIGKKIAATLASTGTPSFFVHLAEALHGDLGMIEKSDIVIFISNSGQANELKTILPLLAIKMITTIAITCRTDSYLSKESTFTLPIAIEEEACPLGLAPSSSAVNTLILGDALALTVMTMKGFGKADFARSHPAGTLGAQLLTQIKQLLKETHRLAYCKAETSLMEAVHVMCKTGLGLIAVVDGEHVIGVFTDGDLRRSLNDKVSLDNGIGTVMTRQFHSLNENDLCSNATHTMNHHTISALPVTNNAGKYVGVINLSTIHEAGIY